MILINVSVAQRNVALVSIVYMLCAMTIGFITRTLADGHGYFCAINPRGDLSICMPACICVTGQDNFICLFHMDIQNPTETSLKNN